MSLTPAAQRALEWLEQQVHDLAAVRNATARDPVFRNWRQATVTVLQRIWPGDMQRLERFRRIPFSSPNPRAEARAIREAYSRGCQEALRVLQDCIEQVRREGIMSAPTVEEPTTPDAIVDGIPTLQLPRSSEPAPSPAPPPAPAEPASTTNALHGDMGDLPPQGIGESCPLPVRKPRRGKKGLRDLLDRAQESARAIVGVPREELPPNLPTDASPADVPAPSERIQDRPADVDPPRTKLRGSIDKVSLDALIGREFRDAPPLAEDESPSATPDVTLPNEPVEATVPTPSAPSDAVEPVAPSIDEAEFAVADTPAVVPPVVTPTPVLRLVTPLTAPMPEAIEPPAAPHEDAMTDAESEAFAEAAETFLQTSPVLSARPAPRSPAARVQEEPVFVEPDAIAIASILDDLPTLGIPESRHPETRARLLDLAQRLEAGDLEWHILRAAVWFAMEYPALACRVVPVLLPRMDRAA